MPLPLARRATPAGSVRPAQAGSKEREQSSRARAANALFGRIIGVVLVGIAVWGLWVAADVPRYMDTAAVPEQHKLNAAVVLLTWLVLFGPFFYFGVVMLRSSFAPEERSWLIPLRVFTYLVGRRFSIARQRREFFSSPSAKPLRPSANDYLDMAPAPGGGKSGDSETSE
jgi:hypothetical protein